jgi:hypothetical protein
MDVEATFRLREVIRGSPVSERGRGHEQVEAIVLERVERRRGSHGCDSSGLTVRAMATWIRVWQVYVIPRRTYLPMRGSVTTVSHCCEDGPDHRRRVA